LLKTKRSATPWITFAGHAGETRLVQKWGVVCRFSCR